MRETAHRAITSEKSPTLIRDAIDYSDAKIKRGGNMATLDWSQCPAVESVPGKRSGAWVFKGSRMPVSTVFESLGSGASIEEIMEWFDVSREQIVAVLDFAARSLDAPPTSIQGHELASVDARSL
jgi:uncharacterized protein (DUF433 family)